MATKYRINPPVPANQGPLRKQVGHTYDEHEVELAVLECGHHIWCGDIYGAARAAARRRCWKCRDEFPLDGPPVTTVHNDQAPGGQR